MVSLPAEKQKDCLLHITEGIELLVKLLEDLVHGNYALADCAMNARLGAADLAAGRQPEQPGFAIARKPLTRGCEAACSEPSGKSCLITDVAEIPPRLRLIGEKTKNAPWRGVF